MRVKLGMAFVALCLPQEISRRSDERHP